MEEQVLSQEEALIFTRVKEIMGAHEGDVTFHFKKGRVNRITHPVFGPLPSVKDAILKIRKEGGYGNISFHRAPSGDYSFHAFVSIEIPLPYQGGR